MSVALQIWNEIAQLRKEFENEKDVLKQRKIFKQIHKLQRMYTVIVSDEEHREIINSMELRTRGY